MGMVIDLKRCIGCYACQLSCKAEHGTPPGVLFARVLKKESGVYPNVTQVFLPVLCNHCDDPPCVDVCPTGASFIHEDGTVDINKEVCVGCRACMLACPYTNRYFNRDPQGYFPGQPKTAFEQVKSAQQVSEVVMKCNFCRQRTAVGKDPACVDNCPTYARIFGDLEDPGSRVAQLLASRDSFTLRPDAGTGPNVHYLAP
jgi:molybdopterin-containing oxidoreductase family iron-sulfur binding subunit